MSVEVLTQTPLQFVSPEPQLSAHEPPLHTTLPPDGALHTLPQVPQLLLS